MRFRRAYVAMIWSSIRPGHAVAPSADEQLPGVGEKPAVTVAVTHGKRNNPRLFLRYIGVIIADSRPCRADLEIGHFRF